jgi:phosphatidylcholine synthase
MQKALPNLPALFADNGWAASQMDPVQAPRQGVTPLTAAAFAVHIFTACGAACALLALMAAADARWSQMFLWLGVATIIDGADGTFARRLRVAEVLPRWSGDVLDLVVDVLNYVFVPAYALTASGLLPALLAVPLGILIVITGSLYFADRRMKTSDYYFRGFPAVWNVAAFYLFLLKLPPWLGAISVVALSALTFMPIHFIHPVRIAHFRALTMVALVLWAILALFAMFENLAPGFWITSILCALALYFIGVGFLRRRHPW